ncbi:Oidioi.mRNA.OKI2018_I69.chr2.g5115.t1.cds [Oikopleura dioica]|uniref:Oidioi.mRNA.OKI2018_I69.chr2.g5115.t1.cds n=1 Tax=Oikopleura dioica TaxID=34765 RepID=A0ABN7T127_OIKDI|nr:Oidioi.mRNA.OKI2018_I69.chr2.g5115.t1.cds [Oikopleura dioica]
MMSVLFPKIGALVLVIGQGLFQAGSSYFRILAIAFDNGFSYEWIIGVNLLLTIPIWIRSIFLFPEMRFNKASSTFSQSFFAKMTGKNHQKSKIQAKIIKEKVAEKRGNVKEHYLDVNYILMVVWIVLLNMNVLNCIFTWNSYARLVAGDNYKQHVDDFGAYAWTAAFFAMLCGFVSDGFAKCIKSRPLKFGKLLGVWIFIILNLLVGIVFGFLQISFDENMLLPLIFVYNIYRSWGYTLTPVFCRFLFPEEFYGILIGIQRFFLGITRNDGFHKLSTKESSTIFQRRRSRQTASCTNITGVDTNIEKIRAIENFVSSLPESPVKLNSPHTPKNLRQKFEFEQKSFFEYFFEKYQIEDHMTDSWALKALRKANK